MKKKLLVAGFAIGAAVIIVPLIAAFEARVINVTAQIENGLLVPIDDITFGTVFPQEELDRTFDVTLSGSFLTDPAVDDIEYVLRQKPKCGLPVPDTDPVQYSQFGEVVEDGQGNFICKDEGFVVLPLLCPYLSKHEVSADGLAPGGENDSAGIPAFHGLPGPWTLATTIANEVAGRLAKSEEDISDTWNLDLKVPCFGGFCAQDWASFVRRINPLANPDDYTGDIADEHELFGCDLWLEITRISEPPGCDKKLDLMLVLDRSGSIDAGELVSLKTAAKAFVDSLAPSADKAHVGMSSFATTASLNQHLTDDGALVKAAIDALVAGGFTNLSGGIDLAKTELDNPGDGHDRPDLDSPDIMVIVTDGAPNRPGGAAAGEAAATAFAAAARAAGIEIFAVGVGTTAATSQYLRDNIVSSPDATHYFDVADFDDLQAVLEGLITCTP
jgi:uncharacterized protein YegL